MSSHRVIKTSSHRARDKVQKIEGVQGPYWVGLDRKRPSIFDRVNGEFWLVPAAVVTEQLERTKGFAFPTSLDYLTDLHPFQGWGSSVEPAPEPVKVLAATVSPGTGSTIFMTLAQEGAILQRKAFGVRELGPYIIAYRTKGGGYMIANDGIQSDSRKPADLIYVHPGGGVVALTPQVHPGFVTAVAKLVGGSVL